MSTPSPKRREKLLADLAELKLHRIAEVYQEVLDEAARKQSSMLDVLEILVAEELAVRRNRALANRIKHARLPPRKTLDTYDFTWPKRIPKQSILRLFDCDFVAQHACAVFIGPTGTGKSHLLNALGYAACEKGISVRFTRVVDMINHLVAAQRRGTLQKDLRDYTRPQLLLLDELGYLPIDKRGAELVVPGRGRPVRIRLGGDQHQPRLPGLGHDLRRGQHFGQRHDRPADAPWGADRD